MKKPLLIGLFGYPGSGKTYFSERLSKKEGYYHLSSDKIRLAMFRVPTYKREEHRTVFRFMDYLASEFLAHGVSVVYDANFNFKKHRKALARLAKQKGARYQLVWVQTEESLALRRLHSRSKLKSAHRQQLYRPIGRRVFNALKQEMELPDKSEPVIIIDGRMSFPVQFKSFTAQQKRLF